MKPPSGAKINRADSRARTTPGPVEAGQDIGHVLSTITGAYPLEIPPCIQEIILTYIFHREEVEGILAAQAFTPIPATKLHGSKRALVEWILPVKPNYFDTGF